MIARYSVGGHYDLQFYVLKFEFNIDDRGAPEANCGLSICGLDPEESHPQPPRETLGLAAQALGLVPRVYPVSANLAP